MTTEFSDMFGTTINEGSVVITAVRSKVLVGQVKLLAKKIEVTPLIAAQQLNWKGEDTRYIRSPKSVVVLDDARASYHVLKNAKTK